jgi:hypothetical protein
MSNPKQYSGVNMVCPVCGGTIFNMTISSRQVRNPRGKVQYEPFVDVECVNCKATLDLDDCKE